MPAEPIARAGPGAALLASLLFLQLAGSIAPGSRLSATNDIVGGGAAGAAIMGDPSPIFDFAGAHAHVVCAAVVGTSHGSALPQGRDPLNLDERILADKPAYHNASRGRPGWTLQQLATDLSGLLIVLEGENEISCLDDVGEATANTLEDPRELVEDLACL